MSDKQQQQEGNCYPVAYQGIAAPDLVREDGVVKCGWLLKKSGNSVRQNFSLLAAYERRFFVLAKGWVYYYKDKSSSKPQKQFTLEGFSKRVLHAEEEKSTCPYVFKIFPSKNRKDGRTWYFGAENEKDMDSWMESFKMEIDRHNPQTNLRGSKSFPGDRKAACNASLGCSATLPSEGGRQRPLSSQGIGESTSGWIPSPAVSEYEECTTQPQSPTYPQQQQHHQSPPSSPLQQVEEQPEYEDCDPITDYDTIELIPYNSTKSTATAGGCNKNGVSSPHPHHPTSPRHNTLPTSPSHPRQLPSIPPSSNHSATLPHHKRPLAPQPSYPPIPPPPPPKDTPDYQQYVDVESPQFIVEDDCYLQPNLLLQQIRNEKPLPPTPLSDIPPPPTTKAPVIPGRKVDDDNMYFDVEVTPEYDCPDSYTPNEPPPPSSFVEKKSSPVVAPKSPPPKYPIMPKNSMDTRPSYLKSPGTPTIEKKEPQLPKNNTEARPSFLKSSSGTPKMDKKEPQRTNDSADVRPSYLKSNSSGTPTKDKKQVFECNNPTEVRPSYLKSSGTPKMEKKEPQKTNDSAEFRPSYLKSLSSENSTTGKKQMYEANNHAEVRPSYLKSPGTPTLEKKQPQIATKPKNLHQPQKFTPKPSTNTTTDTARVVRPSDLKDKNKPSALHLPSKNQNVASQKTEEKRPSPPPKTQAARAKASNYISQHQATFQQVRNNILKNKPGEKENATGGGDDGSKPITSVMSRMKIFEQNKQSQDNIAKKPIPRKPKIVFPKPT